MRHRRQRFAILATVIFLALPGGSAYAGMMQHKDIHTHTVLGSVVPPVLGGSWTVDSRLDILTAENHPIQVGSTAGFHFREFYNLSASSFTPLIVPGTPNVPPTLAGDLLDSKTWTFAIQNEGCAQFDYSTPWTFKIDPNQGSEKTPEFNLGLEKGPISFEVKWGGGSVPPTQFVFTPLPNSLLIEFTTSDLGQGFFRNGGSLSVKGTLKSTEVGEGRVFSTNDHYASGEGLLVDDYTWALPDAAGNPANVRTEVFDRYSCVAPAPKSLTLCVIGILGFAAFRWHRPRVAVTA